jgi:hypothetical protein
MRKMGKSTGEHPSPIKIPGEFLYEIDKMTQMTLKFT